MWELSTGRTLKKIIGQAEEPYYGKEGEVIKEVSYKGVVCFLKTLAKDLRNGIKKLKKYTKFEFTAPVIISYYNMEFDEQEEAEKTIDRVLKTMLKCKIRKTVYRSYFPDLPYPSLVVELPKKGGETQWETKQRLRSSKAKSSTR